MNTHINKAIALVLTINIIAILIIAGPAQAFTLGIDLDKDVVKVGEVVNFEITIDIESNDGVLPVNDIKLTLNGPITESCLFDVSGNILSGCTGITSITRLDSTSFGYGYSPSFGYGYGYGNSNGELRYSITLDTTSYPIGTYNTELEVSIGGNTFSETGDNLIIKQFITSGGSTTTRLSDAIGENNLNSIKTLSITSGATFNFLFKGELHKIVINEIKEGVVYITVFSEPKNIEVRIAQAEEVDLDEDGKSDLSIKAKFIGGNTASITINSEDSLSFTKESFESSEVIKLQNPITNTPISQNYTKKKSPLCDPLIPVSLFILDLIMLEFIAITSISRRKR